MITSSRKQFIILVLTVGQLAGSLLCTAGDEGGLPDSLELGATLEQVILVLGPPESVRSFKELEEVFLIYGHSHVRLKNDKVFRWKNAGELNPYTQNLQDCALITTGSTRSDVIAVHNTPDRVSEFTDSGIEMLHYGNSYIRLKHDQVEKWFNNGELKVTPDAEAFETMNPDDIPTKLMVLKKEQVIDYALQVEEALSSLRFKEHRTQFQVPSAWGSRPFSASTSTSSSRTTKTDKTNSSRNNNSRNNNTSNYNNNNYNNNSYNQQSTQYNRRNNQSIYNQNQNFNRSSSSSINR